VTDAFTVPRNYQHAIKQQQQQLQKTKILSNFPSILSLLAKNKDEEDSGEEEESQEGMIEAFRGLDSLSSLDLSDNDVKSLPPDDPIAAKLAQLEQKINDGDFGSTTEEATPEEAKLYAEMMRELEEEGQAGMYGNVMEDLLEGKEPSLIQDLERAATEDKEENIEPSFPSKNAVESGVGFGRNKDQSLGSASSVAEEPDMDEFMERALREALEEVKSRADIPQAATTESIKDDEETMKELNAIFDKANEQLLESVREIREEQAAMTKANAEARSDTLAEDERRLAEAEGSVSRLLENVNKEAAEVEKAILELKEAQEEMNADPLSKVTNLRDGGLIKQGALVGLVLFASRALAETTALGGVDGEKHFMAAVVQGVIAFFCGIYFFFF